MSIVRRAALACGALIIGSVAVAVAPAGAGVTTTIDGETATLTVTKVVQGEAPSDAQFVIVVDCEETGEHELTFGADGGSDEVIFFAPDSCVITETETGGAVDVTPPIQIEIEDPILYERTITNVFDTADTTASSSTTAATQAAQATRPTFTG